MLKGGFTMLTIPVYDVAVIPHATIYLSREYYKRMTGVEAKAGAEVVFLFEKNDVVDVTRFHKSRMTLIAKHL
jgi:hypothetical protein